MSTAAGTSTACSFDAGQLRFGYAASLCVILSLALAVEPSWPWTLGDFSGRRMDYAYWLRDAGGCYLIDDDPEYEWLGLLNNALLTLAFGDKEAAWKHNPVGFLDTTARRAYHDQMLWCLRKSAVPEDANRVWTDALDTYLHLKDVFSTDEQREIEDWFRTKAKTYGEARAEKWGHQYVPHAFAALTGHVLSQSTTGVDYEDDIQWLWRYASEKSYDFGETLGPIENSGHYVMYVYQSMLRLSVWANGRRGKLAQEQRENLRQAVNWLLDVYPHNGFAVTYGTEWSAAHVPRLIEFLHAAAFYLSHGSPEDVDLAREVKWLATEMFRFGFEHTAKRRTGVEWRPHEIHRQVKAPRIVQANPMWLWRYVDDGLTPVVPSNVRHCSKVVFGEYGNTYGPQHPVLRPSKVVHRSGWDEDALYMLLDLAPRAGKSMPYANAISDISFGSEPFTPGHRLEQGNAGNQQTWDERIVVEPHGGDRWEAEVRWLHDLEGYSASRTDEGTWRRIVSFVKPSAYAVVFDSAPEPGGAHWQFVSDPPPAWHQDWVELVRHGRRLRAHYPNGLRWYDAAYRKDSRLDDSDTRNDVWVVDDPAWRLELKSPGAWAVVLSPIHSDAAAVPSKVSAVDPAANGKGAFPRAAGVRLDFPDYTDWHGVRSVQGNFVYDDLTTDAELFWARQAGIEWTLRFINASQVRLPIRREPSEVTLEGTLLTQGQDWVHADGVLTVTFARRCGTLHIVAAGDGR